MSAFDDRVPFAVGDARAAGITPGLLRGPRYRQVLRGVHVRADVADCVQVRARAALLVHPPSAYASHETAAELLGVPVPPSSLTHVTVSARADRRPRDGLAVHVGGAGATAVVGGVRVSCGTTLFRELAARLELVDLVVAADHLLARRWCTPAQLAATAHGLRGVARSVAVRAAALADMGSESPTESRLRVLLVLAGFPPPVVNGVVNGGGYRLDLSWPALRLAVEYDGQHHRGDLGQWGHDLQRREWLDTNGWRLVVVIATDLFRRPDRVLARVQEAWASCGGTPFAPSQEWRRHFRVIGS
ncbi:endonuclease domain-containing protein [Nocardioides phosphati]|uniref:endonuclease domain-containing protein n=1 Tax=Nocardioides phosphati TaxID=1867775 RepID=UPI00166DA589|nr:DUF559 domain-containing protein [Nocardioides phosphati]